MYTFSEMNDVAQKSPSIQVSTLLNRVIDQMLEGFQVIDRNWKYLYLNQTVANQGKKKSEELIGHTMMECYPGINKTPLFGYLTDCMQNKVSKTIENEFAYPDNSRGWFRLYIHPIEDGILILSLDITAHKKAEQELYIKIQELETLQDTVIDRELKMVELKRTIETLQRITPSIPVPVTE